MRRIRLSDGIVFIGLKDDTVECQFGNIIDMYLVDIVSEGERFTSSIITFCFFPLDRNIDVIVSLREVKKIAAMNVPGKDLRSDVIR